MKKVLKIVVLILIILSIYNMIYNTYAIGDVWGIGDAFLDIGAAGDTIYGIFSLGFLFDGATKTIFESIVDFLWGVGLLVIFISTVVLGIKYMLVLPSEKSRLKQATTPYIIGVICIFGALTIWKFVIYILEGGL